MAQGGQQTSPATQSWDTVEEKGVEVGPPHPPALSSQASSSVLWTGPPLSQVKGLSEVVPKVGPVPISHSSLTPVLKVLMSWPQHGGPDPYPPACPAYLHG